MKARLLATTLLAVAGACHARPGVGRQTTHPGRYDAVVATGRHTCLLDDAGRVRCFGGDGIAPSRMKKAPEVPLSAIATGRRFACGVTRDAGALVCWGACDGAECAPPPAETGFVGLALADHDGGCAWTDAGKLSCWGDGFVFRPPPAHILGRPVRDVVLGTGWGLVLG